MEEVRLGTIGSGKIVHQILDNVLRTEGIRLQSAYSRSKEKAEQLVKEYGGCSAYTDLSAMLTDEAVNTVYIASPNLLHYEQAKAALLAGKNVICEKPFVTRAEQARELSALARERHLVLAEAAPTTYLPNFRLLKEALPKIGRIRLVLSNYSQYSSRYDAVLRGEKPNIFNPEFAGGCLMDINFYNLLLNVVLFGTPKEAVYYPNLKPGLADTSGVLLFKYDDFLSENAGAKDADGVNFFQIEGQKGYIYVENGSNGLAALRVVTKDGEEKLNDQPDPDRWFYEVQEMTRLLLADDYAAFDARLDRTVEAVALTESVRLAAGLRFPGDR